ncbi:MAG: DUF1778 domain-containing protein [Bryobacteraceae bacterium]|jgi:uncharacterized protein (DUF1778 family)
MQRAQNRTARLEARITHRSLAIVRRAAEIQGRSVSDFVVSAAQEAAQKTIAEVEVIRLSREAQEKFAALLLNPPRPTAALVKALKRHRELIAK